MFPPRSVVHFSLFLSTASCTTAHSSFFRTFMCSIHLRPPTTAQRSHSHAICNGGGRERERSAFAALSFSVCKTAPLSPSPPLSLTFRGLRPCSAIPSQFVLWFLALCSIVQFYETGGSGRYAVHTPQTVHPREGERERERERSKGFSKDSSLYFGRDTYTWEGS